MSWRLAQALTTEVSEVGPLEAPIAAQAAAVLLARPRKREFWRAQSRTNLSYPLCRWSFPIFPIFPTSS